MPTCTGRFIAGGYGLHLRTSCKLIDDLQPFDASVVISRDGRSVEVGHGGDLIMLLALSISAGDQFDVVCSGDDAEAAFRALCHFVQETQDAGGKPFQRID